MKTQNQSLRYALNLQFFASVETEHEYTCPDCGCEHDDENPNERCDDCQSDYCCCEECGDDVHMQDTLTVNQRSRHHYRFNQIMVCEYCADRRYIRCDDCGEYYHSTEMVTDINSNEICPVCRDNYYTCEDCGELVHGDNAETIDDGIYCSSCADDHREEEKSDLIWNYSKKPTPNFHGPDNNNEWYGIELEVDKGHSCGDSVVHPLADMLPHCYFKEDGSLDQGFEIVSHPCSYEFHMAQNYKRAFEHLRENGFRSHDTDTCGLHVHISRTAFGEDENEIMYNLSRMMFLVEKFWNQIFKLTRRTESNLQRWAQRYGLDIGDTPDNMYKKNNKNASRYRILNFQNDHTVEFRGFRGTLTENTFKASLQLIKVLHDIAVSKKNLYSLEWDGFKKFVKAKKFDELFGYIAEKGL